MNVIIANMAIALPRSMVSEMKGQLQHRSRETISDSLQISASTPGLFDSAALANVPVNALNKINQWLLVEDEELRDACLAFLYQYTAITDNVEFMVKNLDMEGVVGQLVRLLMYIAVHACFAHQRQRCLAIDAGEFDSDRLPAPWIQRAVNHARTSTPNFHHEFVWGAERISDTWCRRSRRIGNLHPQTFVGFTSISVVVPSAVGQRRAHL